MRQGFSCPTLQTQKLRHEGVRWLTRGYTGDHSHHQTKAACHLQRTCILTLELCCHLNNRFKVNCLEPLHSSYICSFTQWCYRYLLNALYAPSTVTGFRGKKQNIHAFLSIRFSEGQQVNNIHENDIVDYMVMSIAKSGFPGGSVVKNPPANAGEVGLILWSGRSPGERNCNPVQYSCLENPMNRGAWPATIHGVTKESNTT